MEFGIHNVGDAFRLAIFIICALCLALLVRQLILKRGAWNPKTRDYWFAIVMWSLAGVVIGGDGVFHDRPLNVRTVLVLIAALVSLNGLRRQGPWGGND